jgi:hypothetical protein
VAQRACRRAELAYPLCPGTFPIVKRKDEAAHGEYRTKRVILEIYDEMQQAMDRGQPYQTRLDPPAADRRVAHPAKDKADQLEAKLLATGCRRVARKTTPIELVLTQRNDQITFDRLYEILKDLVQRHGG